MPVRLLLLLPFITLVEGLGCQDDWIGHDDSCYLFIGTKEPWVQAGQVCLAHGATLVAIETKEEHLFIKGYIKTFVDLGADIGIWTGGNDMDIEGIWKWSPSGERATYTDWPPSQPNETGDCLLLYKGSNYRFEDAACSQSWSLMCEKPKESDLVIG